MEMGQIVAVGLIGTILSVMLKKQNPELSLLTALATGLILFFFICTQIGFLIGLLRETAEKAGISSGFFIIVLKITGIAYLSQFGMQICADAGEGAIAAKIELAGKILIMTVSAPILLAVLDVVMGLA
jgi:stage III sporulation protein AD